MITIHQGDIWLRSADWLRRAADLWARRLARDPAWRRHKAPILAACDADGHVAVVDGCYVFLASGEASCSVLDEHTEVLRWSGAPVSGWRGLDPGRLLDIADLADRGVMVALDAPLHRTGRVVGVSILSVEED